MHYYQFHIGDYMSHTRHLSIYEDLAYRRLLDFYFLHEQPIKHRDVARQIGLKEYEEAVMTVLNEFFLSTPEGFVNPRADKEINQYKEFVEAGKRGAAKRWSKPPYGEGNSPPNAPPIATNNHKPTTNNHKPNKNATIVAVVPDWIPLETWEAFIQMRKRIGKPPTDYALKLIIAKLDRFRSNGQDVKQVLEKSITSGWQDVFEIKGNPADIVRLTVPSKNEPDPALEKIKEDDKKAAPIPLEVLAKMAQLRKGMQ
jgi:uncharacterized protein YdaU (DUF1376 family)